MVPVKLIKLVAAIVAIGVIVAVGVVLLAPKAKTVATSWDISFDKINVSTLSQPSVVFDRDGQVIAGLRRDENREQIPIERMSVGLIDAIVGSEDAAFFSHGGVSVKGIVRAAGSNAVGNARQGGSTITQQLVKNLVETPEERAKRGLTQKLKEAALAVRIENQMTKDQILELYLNAIYFGNGAYGVQTAAQIYFGKNASDISLGEGALLAALIPGPNDYEPFRHPDRARARRTIVLDRLVSLNKLTREQAFDISIGPMPDKPAKTLPSAQGYYSAEMLKSLESNPVLGATPQERESALSTGGLRIWTTYDQKAQAQAEAARTAELPDSGGKFTAALVAIDPRDGAVRAMLGGRPTEKITDFNVATEGNGRSPGSSFKTFVLIAALESGYSIDDAIDGSSPCNFAKGDGEKDYPVGGHNGSGTLGDQLASSVNCAYVRLGQIVGLDKVADVAKRLGITTKLHPSYLSMPLGGDDVLPFDMAAAYAVIANDGVRNEPYYVDRIEDRFGKVLYQHVPNPQQLLDPQVARQALAALKGVVDHGTGVKAQLEGGRPAAGKTGTNEGGTSSSADAWFVGVTPQLVAAVWIGDPNALTPLDELKGGATVYGGDFPARIWKVFMDRALFDLPFADFLPPEKLGRQAVALCLNSSAKPYQVGNVGVPVNFDLFRRTNSYCTAGATASSSTTLPDPNAPTTVPPTAPPATTVPPTAPPTT